MCKMFSMAKIYFSDLFSVQYVELLPPETSFLVSNLSGWWENKNHYFFIKKGPIPALKFEPWNMVKNCRHFSPLGKKKISHFPASIKLEQIFMQILESRWNIFAIFWTWLVLSLGLQLGKHLGVLWSKQESAVFSFDDTHIKMLVNLN